MVAEFEVWHSRPVAPTRRVALSGGHLPVDPAPGYGGVLLAAIVAAYSDRIDDETHEELALLMSKVAQGQRVPQPQLRHRLQVDRIGLMSSTHRLIADDRGLTLELAEDAPPGPQILAAVYRAGQFPTAERRSIMTLVQSATRWRGGPSAELIAWLTGTGGTDVGEVILDPMAWARDVFGFDEERASRRDVQRRFRSLLRDAHPDHGGETSLAADQIKRLNEARRILLAKGA